MSKPGVKTREQLIQAQNEFHLKQARLPYIKKIRMVDELRRLVNIWKDGSDGERHAGDSGGGQ